MWDGKSANFHDTIIPKIQEVFKWFFTPTYFVCILYKKGPTKIGRSLWENVKIKQ